MKCLLQRVRHASVAVEQAIVGEIDRGLLVFVGVEPSDTDQSVSRMAQRILSYRIFPDEAGKSAAEADAFLQTCGIVVRQVGGYGLPHALRITIGTEAANRAVLGALADFLKGPGPTHE